MSQRDDDEIAAVGLITQWRPPVCFKMNDENAEVSNPVEAMDWLTNRWGGTKGLAWENAKELCVRALANQVSADDARAAFSEALNSMV